MTVEKPIKNHNMKYLNKFNHLSEARMPGGRRETTNIEKEEAIDFTKYFKISEESIEDRCVEMIDKGFKMTIRRGFIDDVGNRTDQPTRSSGTTDGTISFYPIYDVTFNKKLIEDHEERPHGHEGDEGYRYDGGLYHDNISVLDAFQTVLHRLKGLPVLNVVYYISNTIYAIRIVGRKKAIKKEEAGFDMREFIDSINKYSETLGHNLNFQSDGYSNGDKCSIAFKAYNYGGYTRNEVDDMMDNTDPTNFDNRNKLDVLRKPIEDFIKPYQKFLDVTIDYDWSPDDVYTKKVKTGFMKSVNKTLKIYTVEFDFKKKS